MSKRKNRGGSALPHELVERARQQLAEEAKAETAAEPARPAPAPIEEAVAPRAEVRVRTTTPVRRSTTAGMDRRKRDADKLNDIAYIRNRLANPTREFSETQLHDAYGYVIRDLRMTGILAVALVIALIVLERIL